MLIWSSGEYCLSRTDTQGREGIEAGVGREVQLHMISQHKGLAKLVGSSE